MQRFFSPFLSGVLCLLSVASTATAQTSALVDSISQVEADSVRSHQREVQETLQEQFREMTRFPLGSKIESWSHSLDMEVKRGNQAHVQRFWFNLKEGSSVVWLPDTSRSGECLYFDPETDCLASLFPDALNGTLISSAMAAKMGLKGNATATSSKRKSNWKKQPSDSLETFVLKDEASTIQLTLGEKSTWQAEGVNAWLSMQPIPGFSLPPEASKQPVIALEQTRSDDRIVYEVRLIQAQILKTPYSLDLSAIRVSDPSRPLSVIAKEWADKEKN